MAMERIRDIESDGRYAQIAKAVASYCSGGGFDCDWYFEDKGGYVKACTDWHLMNHHGYYMGYYAFTVIIPKKNPSEGFRWYGVGHSKRVLQYHGVDDYLDQSIFEALRNVG